MSTESVTGKMIARSAIIHGSAFLAVSVAAPHLLQMPEGTKHTTIEIIDSQKAPKGRQIKVMKPTRSVQSPKARPKRGVKKTLAPLAKAPVPKKVAARVKPMKVQKTWTQRPKPRKFTPKAVNASSAPRARVRNLNGAIATPIANKQSVKLEKELAALRAQMRRDKLDRIAEKERIKRAAQDQQIAIEKTLAKALEKERLRLRQAQSIRDLQQKNELAAALKAQEAALGAKNRALEDKLARQQEAQEAAQKENQKRIYGQGKALSELKRQNSKLAAANSGLARQISDNQAFGLPSGTRDVRNLRQVAGNVPPQYTRRARLRKQEGQVLLHYYVTPQGRVTGVRVIKSTGYGDLDHEAVKAIGRYRFYPGQQGSTKHVVDFSLAGVAESLSGGLNRIRK